MGTVFVLTEFCSSVFAVDLESSIYTDPGIYYAKSNQKKQRKRLKNKRKRIGDLRGSASSTSSKTSKLKYAFLQPEDSSTITKSGQECHEPNGVFNAFTFMNFALAAATLAGNLVANVNNNAIMTPVGRKKRTPRQRRKSLEALTLRNLSR